MREKQVVLFILWFQVNIYSTISNGIRFIVKPICLDSTGDSSCDIISLNSTITQWKIESNDGVYKNISCSVPSDLQTCISQSDPLEDLNFLRERNVWKGDDIHETHAHETNTSKKDLFPPSQWSRSWIYSTDIELNYDRGRRSRYILVLEGIKMGAKIIVNDHFLGNVTNQFLPHLFLIQDSYFSSNKGDNLLHLEIVFDPSIDTNGRFMACSGGWDWAPYTRVHDNDGRRMFSFGITKPVNLLRYEFSHSSPVKEEEHFHCATSITHVVPKISFLGDYPKTPMLVPESDFQLEIDIHLQTYHFDSEKKKGIQDIKDYLSNGVIALKADFAFPEEILYNASSIIKHTNTSSIEIPQESIENNTSIVHNFIISLSLTIPKQKIQLWYPRGVFMDLDLNKTSIEIGKLYNIQIQYRSKYDSKRDNNNWITKKIAFRTIELITHNEPHLSQVKEGTGSHGMYFRINGSVVFCRGANLIPMSQLTPTEKVEAYQLLVESVARANMNMIRIWGGGVAPPQEFYEACDALGILIYHDLMFSEEQKHGAIRNDVIEHEIRYLVRKISSHPSVVVYSSCNECKICMNTESSVYATFVMSIVAEEDPKKMLWPSSPSKYGWETGVDQSGLPNGNSLSVSQDECDDIDNLSITHSDLESRNIKMKSSSKLWKLVSSRRVLMINMELTRDRDLPEPLELHGPYYHGYSETFPTINGNPLMGKNEKIEQFLLEKRDIGVEYPSQFISEFGASSFSSFESMSAKITDKSNWNIHSGSEPNECHQVNLNDNQCYGSNIMAERNYACDNFIQHYFGRPFFDNATTSSSASSFQRQLYACMISQAMIVRNEILNQRSANVFGSLLWQLNENWPTGGWGLVEYSSDDPGQVLGGRWKILMYWLKRYLFRGVFATCDVSGYCFFRNDLISIDSQEIEQQSCVIDIDIWDVLMDASVTKIQRNVGCEYQTLEYFYLKEYNIPEIDPSRHLILLEISRDFETELMGRQEIFLTTFDKLNLTSHNGTEMNLTIRFQNESQQSCFYSSDVSSYQSSSCFLVEISVIAEEQSAFFIMFTSLAQGNFNDNAITLLKGEEKIISFYTHRMRTKEQAESNSQLFFESLRMEHLQSILFG